MLNIFDGHNDVLSLIASRKARLIDIKNGYDSGHIDLPRAKAGGFGGGLFAIFVEDDMQDTELDELLAPMENPPYDLPLSPAIDQSRASPAALKQAALLPRLDHMGVLRVCTDTRSIRQTMQEGNRIAAVMHMEGAEAIDENFDALEVLYASGLRSLGPVWSRPNQYGHGVPFAFPSTPDTGNGLTDLGVSLVKACNQLGIMLDVSHLNAKGFWDIVKHSASPVVASHSNAHALCPHSRNLTDDQLSAIAETNGLVGINFATATLRSDGKSTSDTDFQPILRHLDHLIDKIGEDRVALGSDFDGATIPSVIGDCAGLAGLFAQLHSAGYDQALLQKLAADNWISLLERVWES